MFTYKELDLITKRIKFDQWHDDFLKNKDSFEQWMEKIDSILLETCQFGFTTKDYNFPREKYQAMYDDHYHPIRAVTNIHRWIDSGLLSH